MTGAEFFVIAIFVALIIYVVFGWLPKRDDDDDNFSGGAGGGGGGGRSDTPRTQEK